LSESYYSRYSDVMRAFSNRKALTIEYFHKELLMDEETIGFQFWLSDEIATLSKKHSREWNPNLQKQTAHILYNRDLHYFYGALEQASSGLCDPCYNNLRTIYESILKMYYLWANPSDAENVNKDMENPKRPKYDHNYLIQHLYSKNMQDSMRKFFREISAKAHSSYTGIAATFEYSAKQVKDCLDSILMLSFYNITAEVENQSLEPSILEESQFTKIGNYLEKLRQVLVDEKGNMPSFFPDKPELWKKLGIKPGSQ